MAHSVHLMNEFNLAWPVWGGAHGCERSEPDDWELPDDLTTRILAWAAVFNEHYSWKHGWDDCSRERDHRVEGQHLRRLLQQELGPDHDVELRLWECAPTPRIA
ncbi:hypothetical protein [Plantibacter sp. YIM 135347]|uniref:hypothetical protein n=1 Tax=Plantibacter sp. YIM 135347 TaxID=3423919 RepID=UPI003D354AEB